MPKYLNFRNLAILGYQTMFENISISTHLDCLSGCMERLICTGTAWILAHQMGYPPPFLQGRIHRNWSQTWILIPEKIHTEERNTKRLKCMYICWLWTAPILASDSVVRQWVWHSASHLCVTGGMESWTKEQICTKISNSNHLPPEVQVKRSTKNHC